MDYKIKFARYSDGINKNVKAAAMIFFENGVVLKKIKIFDDGKDNIQVDIPDSFNIPADLNIEIEEQYKKFMKNNYVNESIQFFKLSERYL